MVDNPSTGNRVGSAGMSRPSPSAALMERMVNGGADLLRDDDSLLRQMFFSVLR